MTGKVLKSKLLKVVEQREEEKLKSYLNKESSS